MKDRNHDHSWDIILHKDIPQEPSRSKVHMHDYYCASRMVNYLLLYSKHFVSGCRVSLFPHLKVRKQLKMFFQVSSIHAGIIMYTARI